MKLTSRSDLTFKHNIQQDRHGWLRLTPAYSVKLVTQLLDANPDLSYVLDPFCGTGTTALVCGERGVNCDSLDINPFLVWFARLKTTNFTVEQLSETRQQFGMLRTRIENGVDSAGLWSPPIKDIDKWWSANTLTTLSKLYASIGAISDTTVRSLYLIAFCRLTIEASNASFNHQSMSFKKPPADVIDPDRTSLLLDSFGQHLTAILQSVDKPVTGRINILLADARRVPEPQFGSYDGVITSPPYPNRMSYIRELRPYMYWLGYLHEAREAGELDWQAIGGTWGVATSRISKWEPSGVDVNYADFPDIISRIASHSGRLANYVHKYFLDIVLHVNSLEPQLKPGAKLFYIVGNSKFYDTLVPVEQIYAGILRQAGFVDVEVTAIRKRNSKKELFEFIVSAKKARRLPRAKATGLK